MILDFPSTARHPIERSLDNWHSRANGNLFGYRLYESPWVEELVLFGCFSSNISL
jgi:hypothetical protein